jgi:pilus assembly protein Flp/PilA
MRKVMNRFRRDDRGATATEYAVLIVFVALAVAVGANILGNDLSNMFSKIGASLAAVTLPTLP